MSVVALLVLIIMFLALKYFKKDDLVERFRYLLVNQLTSSHQMIHKFRDHFFSDIRMQLQLARNKEIQSAQIAEISRLYYNKVCHSILIDIRNLFLDYYEARGFHLKDDLTVTVKVIIRAEQAQQILDKLKGGRADTLNINEKYITTGYRDPFTWEQKPERNEIRQIVYHINEENTAFDEILNHKKEYLFSNDLLKLSLSGKYRNQNPNWQKHYNSTLAVAIQYVDKGNPNAVIPYGVLAIDSLNLKGHDLFDDNITRQMLETAADTLAIMFGNMELLDIIKDMIQLSEGDNKL